MILNQISAGSGPGDGLAATYDPPSTFGQANITSIAIPAGVTILSADAFRDWSALASATMPDGLLTIGNYAFQSTALTSATIPDTVTTIGTNAFGFCFGLTSVTIPATVTSISANAFYSCDNLATAVFEDGATVIGGFNECPGLTSVTIPSTATSVVGSAFFGCSSLASITLPAAMSTIGTYAFRNCTSLMEITCHATTPPTAGYGFLLNVPATCSIKVPAASVAAYQAASYWSDRSAYISAI